MAAPEVKWPEIQDGVPIQRKSPLAQVGQQQYDLVTDEWLGVAGTSEPGDRARNFF